MKSFLCIKYSSKTAMEIVPITNRSKYMKDKKRIVTFESVLQFKSMVSLYTMQVLLKTVTK